VRWTPDFRCDLRARDLLGLDHERLMYRFSGWDMPLTDVHGQGIRDVLVWGERSRPETAQAFLLRNGDRVRASR